MAVNIYNFKLFHQNIRSLRRNFDNLVCHLQSLTHLPNLIIVSEIWIENFEVDLYAIKGFKFFAKCNKYHRSGGVGVFAADNLKVKVLNVLELETVDVLALDVIFDNTKVTIVSIYRLQSFSVGSFLAELNQLLPKFKSQNMFFLGDVNIDILKSSTLIDEYNLLMSSHGLASYVNEPTRILGASATCIDHVYYRGSLFTVNSIVSDLQITDHCAIEVSCTFSRQSKKQIKTVHNADKFLIDTDLLNNSLLTESWSKVISTTNISNAFDLFFTILGSYIKQCQYKVRPPKNKTKKLKPWINNSLLFKIKKKNSLSKKLKLNCNNLILKFYVRKLTKDIKKDIFAAKSMYYLSRFQRVAGKGKQQWALINELVNEGISSDIVDDIMDEQRNIFTSPADISNCFNSYFIGIVSKARQELDHYSQFANDSVVCDRTNNNSFFFRPITSSELYFIINSLDDKKSADAFGISNWLFKKINCNIVDILSVLFNRSVTEGVFPDSVKVATVIPLHKQGDRSAVINYRPISLLPVISKIFEKAIKTRMVDFLDNFNFLSNSQFGFRCKLSTEDALLELMNPIHSGINNSEKVSALFIDITKAFDMVDHSILLKKLWNIGFRGCTYNWLKSFILCRSQRVRYGGFNSSVLALDAGVPQGSVLGPILFLIYINSVFRQNYKGKVVAFADDMAFMYHSPSHFINASCINHDLEVLANWFGAHKLILSPKTKTMIFDINEACSFNEPIIYHDTRCPKSGSCLENCLPIEYVHNIKYLGLNVDSRLNWKCHISNLKDSLNSCIRKMYILRYNCSFNVLKIFYHALVESRLRYGICCWGGTYLETLRPLFVAQKFVLRVMHFKNRLSSSWPLFHDCNILPLKHLYVYKVLNIYFERSGNRILSCQNYTLRKNDMHLHLVPKFTKTHFFNYFLVTAPLIFNKLPAEIRSLKSKSKYLSLVKSWLFQLPSVKFIFERIV